MNRRGFLFAFSAAFFGSSIVSAAEPAAFAPPPVGYTGPFRAWGPRDETGHSGHGRHIWSSEIAPTSDGPFTGIRPHALEWWNGARWIGTD